MPDSVSSESKGAAAESLARLTQALGVVINQSVRKSLNVEPEIYVDALLPAFLPSLKRAIATFMSDFVSSIQRILERSLSIESVKWRFEAMRTGRPLSEIALMHSLVYRVEQVLLFDHETGLLLGHAASTEIEMDPDLVSGMLTAITDFIRDSFQIRQVTGSGTFQYGDQLIWTERGQKVTLAALIRGQPQPKLRDSLQDNLRQMERVLEPFWEDPECKTRIESIVNEGLKTNITSQYRAITSGKLWRYVATAIVGLILLIPIFLGASYFRKKILFKNYENALKDIPGVIVFRSEIKGNRFHFQGFKDLYSANPATVLHHHNLDPEKAVLDLQSFISLDPIVLEKRLRHLILFPNGVQFVASDGILHMTGTVPRSWLKVNSSRLRMMADWLPLDISRLKEIPKGNP